MEQKKKYNLRSHNKANISHGNQSEQNNSLYNEHNDTDSFSEDDTTLNSSISTEDCSSIDNSFNKSKNYAKHELSRRSIHSTMNSSIASLSDKSLDSTITSLSDKSLDNNELIHSNSVIKNNKNGMSKSMPANCSYACFAFIIVLIVAVIRGGVDLHSSEGLANSYLSNIYDIKQSFPDQSERAWRIIKYVSFYIVIKIIIITSR